MVGFLTDWYYPLRGILVMLASRARVSETVANRQRQAVYILARYNPGLIVFVFCTGLS